MNLLPADELIEILKPAYEPCKFFESCAEAKWSPESGYLPRGYLGATGKISEVEVVFVLAEPGHPLEKYPKNVDALTHITNCVEVAYECYFHNTCQGTPLGKNGIGHLNLRYVINMLWPNLSFDQQLRKVWITESRLCSIKDEIGKIKPKERYVCADNYLRKQLELLFHAEVISFGDKAHAMLDQLGAPYHKAWALYPPGANNPKAKESWRAAVDKIQGGGR